MKYSRELVFPEIGLGNAKDREYKASQEKKILFIIPLPCFG
jgi:hypothetical protein